MSSKSKQLIIAYLPASKHGLSYRGSEVAMLGYAEYSQSILGHKSIICLGENSYNEPLVLDYVKSLYPIIYFKDTIDLEKKLLDNKVDAFYCIRYGRIEEPMLKTIPMLIHCVYDMTDPGGFISAGVSKSVADRYNRQEYVPHLVSLYPTDENYRKTLNIPDNAIVFGRHGGEDTFDLPIMKNVIMNLLKNREDIYFIFAVRPLLLNDISHPRLICLNIFYHPKIKRKFINTCDAMIHAQSLGETFGLSVGEFSMANKPVITWNGGRCKEHLRILGDKCIKYNNEEELYQILNNFNPEKERLKNWKAYDEYNPENVMKQFDEVFLKPLSC